MKKNAFRPFIVSLSILFLASTVLLQSQIEKPVMGPEARLKSWQQHVKLKSESPYKDLKWRAVGPEFMGGRVETISCHPSDPFTIYVGVGSGNLWKTINHGTTWDPIFDDQPVFAMGCVAIAPSDPDVLWVGTGEVLMARSSYAGFFFQVRRRRQHLAAYGTGRGLSCSENRHRS